MKSLFLVVVLVAVVVMASCSRYTRTTKDNFQELAYLMTQWGWYHSRDGISLQETMTCLTNYFTQRIECNHSKGVKHP